MGPGIFSFSLVTNLRFTCIHPCLVKPLVLQAQHTRRDTCKYVFCVSCAVNRKSIRNPVWSLDQRNQNINSGLYTDILSHAYYMYQFSSEVNSECEIPVTFYFYPILL